MGESIFHQNVGIQCRYLINLVRMSRFWNDLHQVAHSQNIGKPNNLITCESKKTRGPQQDTNIRLKLYKSGGD